MGVVDLQLKKLEIQGFKSFANKVEIDFENPVTAVVGPNGSGKSNISDAIRWVLGEQGAKSLRGNKMEDIIFTGTINRKALGMAEVSLTLDNSSQKLDIDYNEVKITRRMYRSGESEYYLNKSSCRLKDIRELLMDTGIGKDGYSIIGQGKIDEILSSKSEDRRQLFEEAAGIVKYKHRKYEAEKKLADTKDNLLRVKDILYELENQLEPLKKQSAKVIKYNEINEKLFQFEINLFIREIDKIDGELKHIQQQTNMLKESLIIQNTEKENHTVELHQLQEDLQKIEQKTIEKQEDFYHIKNSISKIEGEIKVIQQKSFHSTENIKRLQKDIKDIEDLNNSCIKKLDNKLIQLENVNMELNELEEKLENYTNEYKEVIQLKTIKEKEVEKSKGDIIDILNDISDKKAEANSLKTLLQTMKQQQEQINQDTQNYNDKKNEREIKFHNLKKDLKNNYINIQKINDEITMITKEKDIVKNKEIKLFKQLEETKKELHHKISKKNILSEMDREGEGYSKSVKNLINACNNNLELAKGVHGTVADLLKVAKGYERAMESALGASIQNIITSNEEIAKKLINYLKQHNLGRVTLLPISSIQKKNIRQDEFNIIKRINDVNIAIDVIEYEEKFYNIFSYLLSRVLIVPDLDIAIQTSRKLQHKFKIVTLQGDIMNIGGSLTGGSNVFKGSSILTRKRELEELTAIITKLEIEEENFQQQHNTLLNNIRNFNERLDYLNTCQQEYKILEATLESRIQQLEDENKEKQLLMKQLQAENIQINQVYQITLDKYTAISKDIGNMETGIADIKNSLVNDEKYLLKEKQRIESLNDIMTKEKINHASIKEQKKSLLQEIESLQGTIAEGREQRKVKEKEIVSNDEEGKQLQSEKSTKEKQLKSLSQNIIFLQNELEGLKITKENLLQREKNKIEILKQVEEVILELKDSNYKLDMKSTRLEMQQQNFYTKLWEDYELTYKDAKDLRENLSDNVNITKEIKQAKDEINSLGHINPQAIEEYENIKERYEFLHEQSQDLERAKESLGKVIKDIEYKMEKQFINEFIKIKTNFNEVFRKLFGGGKAQLVLEDEKDILNCGIEIIAQPPGKKLQSLSLLSGGERALTAISLLFGILLVKPSPFCILDEIEAALDDANVNRFAKFLQELSSNTQFIVITHRKGTMEHADVLYGITMEEEGVSKIVSLKLTDEISKEIAS